MYSNCYDKAIKIIPDLFYIEWQKDEFWLESNQAFLHCQIMTYLNLPPNSNLNHIFLLKRYYKRLNNFSGLLPNHHISQWQYLTKKQIDLFLNITNYLILYLQIPLESKTIKTIIWLHLQKERFVIWFIYTKIYISIIYAIWMYIN